MWLLQGRGHENGTAVKHAAELTDGLIHDRIVKRVSRREQVGVRLAVRLDVREVKGDAVVLGCNRAVLAGADMGGHVGDLVPSLLAPGDPTSQPDEGCSESQLDVVRLKAASAGTLTAGNTTIGATSFAPVIITFNILTNCVSLGGWLTFTASFPVPLVSRILLVALVA